MDSKNPFGLYLFQKEKKEAMVLKDLLQLMRSQAKNRQISFSYVETETSLIPHLSLLENLQLVSGTSSLKEIQHALLPDYHALIKLIPTPQKLASDAEPWEKFHLSLIKGLLGQGCLLVDMNEDLLSPLMVQNLKKMLMKVAAERPVFLASASSSLWLDCAHSIISRQEFKFVFEELDMTMLKKHWA